MNAKLVLIIPVGDSNLPDFGGGIPAYGGGHPSHGLPSSPGHPSHDLPGGGHISTGPIRPPVEGIVWPPRNPNRPDNSLPPLSPGTKPIQPPTAGTKPVVPEEGLPAGSSLVLVYNAEHGWKGAVVDQSGTTKPIAPPSAQPK